MTHDLTEATVQTLPAPQMLACGLEVLSCESEPVHAPGRHFCVDIEQVPSQASPGVPLITSIGVATAWQGDPDSKSADLVGLFKAADAALYRAKFAGRNRVVAD